MKDDRVSKLFNWLSNRDPFQRVSATQSTLGQINQLRKQQGATDDVLEFVAIVPKGTRVTPQMMIDCFFDSNVVNAEPQPGPPVTDKPKKEL